MPVRTNYPVARKRAGLPVSTINYAVLLFPGFPMLAFSSIIEPLRAANTLANQTHYSWTTIGALTGAVRSSSGISVEADHSAGNAPVCDRVVVCSGGDADHVVADSATTWLRHNQRNGAHLGAVADGAFFLARAGMLDGHVCTLHWTSQPAFAEAFPDVELRSDLFVIDGKRFTAAGGVGCLDMMLEIIGQDLGQELAAGVAEWFVHSQLRSSIDRRMMPLRLRTGIRDELVLSAVAAMEEAVEDRLSMAVLARRLHVSPDRLERVFQAETGASPRQYYKQMRLRRANDLLRHSSLTIRDVALSCGYDSLSSFARSFREQFGRTPRQARQKESVYDQNAKFAE